jgi:hypothetical protein
MASPPTCHLGKDKPNFTSGKTCGNDLTSSYIRNRDLNDLTSPFPEDNT